MKTSIILISFLLVFSNLCLAQKEVKKINGIEFTFITTVRDDTLQIEFLELFRGGKKLLTHTYTNIEGDCSSENIELGGYKIIDSNIIFYTYWASGDRMGNNIYPYGFRKQIYSVADNGTILLTKSELYIESRLDTWEIHKGMKYLIQQPKTKIEHKLLNDYVLKAEKKYHAKFVFSATQKALETEIRKELKPDIDTNTSYWKEVYKDNCKM